MPPLSARAATTIFSVLPTVSTFVPVTSTRMFFVSEAILPRSLELMIGGRERILPSPFSRSGQSLKDEIVPPYSIPLGCFSTISRRDIFSVEPRGRTLCLQDCQQCSEEVT